jgi:hypothetical protein
MRSVRLLVSCFVCSCLIFACAGCQESAKASKTPKTLTKQNDLTTPITTKSQEQPRAVALAAPEEKAKPVNSQAVEPVSTVPQTVVTTTEQKSGPVITFEKEEHDFGDIGADTYNKCVFKFENTGDSLLAIKDIHAPCGCTVPRISKNDYAPGETGQIEVTYHASGGAGAVLKTADVPSNDPKRPTVRLTLKAKIVTAVRYEPLNIDLQFKGSNANCPKITLTSGDGQPFAIKDFSATSGAITAAFDPSVEKTQFVIDPNVDLAKLEKVSFGSISIKLSHPKCPTISIPVRVIPRYRLQPPSLLIRNAEPNQPTIRDDVWIINNYSEDFEIESAVSEAGYVKLLSKEKIDQRYKLKVQITPPAGEDKRFFSDNLVIKLTDGTTLTLGCRGFYASPQTKAGATTTNATPKK